VRFKQSKTGKVIHGKVVHKHKKTSINKNILTIKHQDGSLKDYDFSEEVDEWNDAGDKVSEDTEEPCCLYSLSPEENVSHDCYATVLSKAQYKNKPGVNEAMIDEIHKFEKFDAFKTVDDHGQYAIKTRWVVTEHDDTSKGYKLKTRLCMRGDRENNVETVTHQQLIRIL
jgi:hypothetical protein